MLIVHAPDDALAWPGMVQRLGMSMTDSSARYTADEQFPSSVQHLLHCNLTHTRVSRNSPTGSPADRRAHSCAQTSTRDGGPGPPRRPNKRGSTGPNRCTVGVPIATARCNGPLSTPTPTGSAQNSGQLAHGVRPARLTARHNKPPAQGRPPDHAPAGPPVSTAFSPYCRADDSITRAHPSLCHSLTAAPAPGCTQTRRSSCPRPSAASNWPAASLSPSGG